MTIKRANYAYKATNASPNIKKAPERRWRCASYLRWTVEVLVFRTETDPVRPNGEETRRPIGEKAERRKKDAAQKRYGAKTRRRKNEAAQKRGGAG